MKHEEITSTRISVISWIVYDIGNTLFFSGVVGLVFPLWITRVMGGTDATVGYALAVSMGVVFTLSPILGVLSDKLEQKMPFLTISMIVGIFCTLLIGVFSYEYSLGLFCISVSAVQLAAIFYNGLLADVSSRDNVGFIGGLGVGVGYLGGIVSVLLGFVFLESKGHIYLFRLMGILELGLVLPLMVVGKYKVTTSEKLTSNRILSRCFNIAKQATGRLIENREWLRFLIARFWYLWAVNAASAFAVLYGIGTVKLSEIQVQLVLLTGILSGIPMGALWGRVVDRVGAFTVLKWNILGWVFLLALAAGIPLLGLPKYFWWVVGVLSGTVMAGLYVSERPFVLLMAPERRLGEYFGMSSMVGRAAAIVGPLSWALISVTMGLGQVAAILWLLVCVTIAFTILSTLKVSLAD